MKEGEQDMRKTWFALLSLVVLPGLALAANGPRLVSYQGVLRDAANRPLTGTYAMTLRLFSAETGGDEILVDSHSAVVVDGGLFTVQIGGGTVSDGSGPGRYTFLPAVFADYGSVYLEVEVAGEVLTPRVAISSIPYAFNTRYVDGFEAVTATPLSLYVNGVTGDDSFSGLFPGQPKRTIQAAVDRIPTIIAADVTVFIAPGTYAEKVLIADRVAPMGNWIRLVGDVGDPSTVRVSGSGVRDNVVEIRNNPRLSLEGLTFEGAVGTEGSGDGVQIFESTVRVLDCRFENNASSGLFTWNSFVEVADSTFSSNGNMGLNAVSGAYVSLDDVSVTGNGGLGIDAESGARVAVYGFLEVVGNAREGCSAEAGGFVDFEGRGDVRIQGNNAGGPQTRARLHGIVLGYDNALIDLPKCAEELSGTCYPGRY